MEKQDLDRLVDKVVELILNSRGIVVFTGAGVSTESGIPDFRGPGGIWTRYAPDLFTYQRFVSDPESRRLVWRMMMEEFSGVAEPNPAHYAIAELERMVKLDCVITQNIDNLHQRAGTSEGKVFELHGNLGWVICLQCRNRYKMEEIRRRLEQGIDTPDCESCHGMLKPDGVFFGEALPERVLQEATHRSRNCDLFVVIGSTLVVYPAAYMPIYALQAGAKLVLINLSPTPLDDQATVLIQAKAGETMTKVMEGLRKKVAGEGRVFP